MTAPLVLALGQAAAWLLAAVFAWAAAAKLARPGATAASFARLGLPAPKRLALAVPLIEAVLAGLLVVHPGWGGAVALLLLVVFSGFLGSRLRRGQRVGCGCFGASGGAALSGIDLARNAALGAGALLAARATVGVPSLPALITVVTGAVSVMVVLALLRVRAETGRLLDNTVVRGPQPDAGRRAVLAGAAGTGRTEEREGPP